MFMQTAQYVFRIKWKQIQAQESMNNELQQVTQLLPTIYAYDFLLLLFLLCCFNRLCPFGCQCKWKWVKRKNHDRNTQYPCFYFYIHLIEIINYKSGWMDVQSINRNVTCMHKLLSTTSIKYSAQLILFLFQRCPVLTSSLFPLMCDSLSSLLYSGITFFPLNLFISPLRVLKIPSIFLCSLFYFSFQNIVTFVHRNIIDKTQCISLLITACLSFIYLLFILHLLLFLALNNCIC